MHHFLILVEESLENDEIVPHMLFPLPSHPFKGQRILVATFRLKKHLATLQVRSHIHLWRGLHEHTGLAFLGESKGPQQCTVPLEIVDIRLRQKSC
jgi:hypothetical protein